MGSTHFSGRVVALGVPLPQFGGHLGGRVLYVRSAGATYDFPTAHGTMAGALANAKSGDTIVLLGDLREEVVGSNSLFDITIIGAGTRPRHDDKHNFTSSQQIGTGSWRNSSGVTTTALCKVQAQGWKFVNILFDAPTSAACVELDRTADSGEDEIDASHASFIGCRFAGGETGIEGIGTENVFNVSIEGCTFHDLTDGIKGVNGYRWQISGNYFYDNTNHMDLPLVESKVVDNVFGLANTKGVDLTGGSNNVVSRNAFHGDYNVLNTAGTTDMWGGNFVEETGGVSDADPTGS